MAGLLCLSEENVNGLAVFSCPAILSCGVYIVKMIMPQRCFVSDTVCGIVLLLCSQDVSRKEKPYRLQFLRLHVFSSENCCAISNEYLMAVVIVYENSQACIQQTKA